MKFSPLQTLTQQRHIDETGASSCMYQSTERQTTDNQEPFQEFSTGKSCAKSRDVWELDKSMSEFSAASCEASSIINHRCKVLSTGFRGAQRQHELPAGSPAFSDPQTACRAGCKIGFKDLTSSKICLCTVSGPQRLPQKAQQRSDTLPVAELQHLQLVIEGGQLLQESSPA